MDGNFLISVTVELDPLEYPAEDVKWHAHRIKRALVEMCPNAAVKVKAGRHMWWEPNNDWSRAA